MYVSTVSPRRMARRPRYWSGPVRHTDDFGRPIVDVFWDAATRGGPWAIMSPESHRLHALGAGVGLGQQYTRQPDGRWLKTEG